MFCIATLAEKLAWRELVGDVVEAGGQAGPHWGKLLPVGAEGLPPRAALPASPLSHLSCGGSSRVEEKGWGACSNLGLSLLAPPPCFWEWSAFGEYLFKQVGKTRPGSWRERRAAASQGALGRAGWGGLGPGRSVLVGSLPLVEGGLWNLGLPAVLEAAATPMPLGAPHAKQRHCTG